jgi:hypothetical protein
VDFRYRVYAYSSFHFMGDAEKYLVGEFADCASAVAVCEKIVDDFLSATPGKANSPETLLEEYESSGPEPYIESDDPDCRFSAIDYVHQRIRTHS